MTTATIERVSKPPECCPRCKRDNAELEAMRIGTGWVRYLLIDDAPAVGCGACGCVIYLS
jgi:hypothetical protein